jgi:hypothetical protein
VACWRLGAFDFAGNTLHQIYQISSVSLISTSVLKYTLTLTIRLFYKYFSKSINIFQIDKLIS